MTDCEAHRFHRPRPHTVEKHHVIPQDWQEFWRPPEDPGKHRLWAPETITLCPTGHRNVHVWIVNLMRGVETNAVPVSFITNRGRGKEFDIAAQALIRWQRYGGGLLELRQAGHLGRA